MIPFLIFLYAVTNAAKDINAGSCVDDPTFNCKYVSTLINICDDVIKAEVVCKNFCHVCNVVDGNWTEWASWSSCDTTCAKGHITRIRTCTNPAPANGGLNCTGISSQNKPCTMDPCPVLGGWSDWTGWSGCSVTCGIGLIIRKRTCSNPVPQHIGDHCFGQSDNYQPCFLKACKDGKWSSWEEWSTCTIESVTKRRSRQCDNPTPSNFGRPCVGNEEDFGLCLDSTRTSMFR